MMKGWGTFTGIVGALVAACDGGGGDGTAATSGPNDPGAAQVTGTLGGVAFAPVSGLANIQSDGTLDLAFSTTGDVCGATRAAKYHAGETRLLLYRLSTAKSFDSKAVVGEKLTTSDSKYFRVTAECPSGEVMTEARSAKNDRAKTTEVTLTKLGPDTVEGTITTSYDDGSAVTGPFKLAVCAAEDFETSYCF